MEAKLRELETRPSLPYFFAEGPLPGPPIIFDPPLEAIKALARVHANIDRAMGTDVYEVTLGLSLTPEDVRFLQALKIDPWR